MEPHVRRGLDAQRAAAMAAISALSENRSPRGAHTQASVLRTIRQRELDAAPILSRLLRSPRPVAALAPPPSVQ